MTSFESIVDQITQHRTDVRTDIILCVNSQAKPSLLPEFNSVFDRLLAVKNATRQTIADPHWDPAAMTQDMKEDPVEVPAIVSEIAKASSYMRTYHYWHIFNKTSKSLHNRFTDFYSAPRNMREAMSLISNSLIAQHVASRS